MKVSVIISTYSIERAHNVKNCIHSVQQQTLPSNEIILVLDSNPKLSDFYRLQFNDEIKIVNSGGIGLSQARNAGVKHAEGDIVAFIDDDAIAERDWLEKLIKNYSDPSVVAVGGSVKAVWQECRPRWFPEELDWAVGCTFKGFPEKKSHVRNPIGANMSFRKNIIERVGYFKTNLGRFKNKLLCNEETDISIRILNMMPTAKIIYDPSCMVYHKISNKRANLKYLIKRAYYEGLSKSLISNKSSNINDIMLPEKQYLKNIFKTVIISKLKKFYKYSTLMQIFALIISTSAVIIGYVKGHTMRASWISKKA